MNKNHPVWGALVIDMQEDLVYGNKHNVEDPREGLLKEDQQQLINNHKEFLTYLSNCSIPFFAVELRPKKHGPTINPIKTFFSNQKQHIIPKYRNNGFSTFYLEQTLQQFNLTHLMLTGINANVCVLATAQAGKEKGYHLYTSCDLIGSEADQKHEHPEAITNLAQIATITTTKQELYALIQQH
ncbi:cysteine hydrolase [Candidatus Woesearchaeota archaeon]|nr:cysteine hydrolase [Candidatus Woesearchaeota archaeon]